MSTTVFYTPTDDDGAHRHKVVLDADYDLEDGTWNDSIAEQCADDWHSNHDGWEAQWPRVFVLYADKEGPELARFEVERETVPHFMAMPVSRPSSAATGRAP